MKTMEEVWGAPLAPPPSHLPAWYLDMKRSLESSKANHARVESHLGELQSHTKALSDKIQRVDDTAVAVAAAASRAVQCTERVAARPRGVLLTRIPSDALGYTLRFLDTADICKLNMMSKELKELCAENKFWRLEFRSRCPHLPHVRAGSVLECRSEIIAHAHAAYDCFSFVRTMKQQRSVVRHSTVAPHRFSRSEKTVSHPLPLFDRSSSARAAAGSVMSEAETFSADMHTLALRALDTMLRITSHERDPIHGLLQREGVVTVLVSLLANEAGHVQELACGILANLLVWEARHRWDSGQSSDQNKYTVAKQLMACDGRNKLYALLTSPSASVNLAGPGERLVTMTGATELRTRSSVQGMACRTASRALICLFHKSDPIPSPHRVIELLPPPESDAKPTCDRSEAKPAASADTALSVEPRMGRLGGRMTGSSSLSSPASSKQQVKNSISGKVSPVASHAGADTSTRVAPRASLELGARMARDGVVPAYLTTSVSSNWEISYYFKSGALCAVVSAQILFSPHAVMYGRGLDTTGPFILYGSAATDFEGTTWLIHKVYARELTVSVEEWVSVPFTMDEMVTELSGTGAHTARRAHLSHSAFWSASIEERTNTWTPEGSESLSLAETVATTAPW